MGGGKGEREQTGERMRAGRQKGERGKVHVGGRGEEKRKGTGVEAETDL